MKRWAVLALIATTTSVAVAAPTAPREPATCSLGDAVVIAKAKRTPKTIEIAVHGDRTGVVWIDGGAAYAAVVDAAGALVGTASQLTERGGFIRDIFIFTAPNGFLVVTLEDDYCVLFARTLDATGVLGAKTRLIDDACSPFSDPIISSDNGELVALTSMGYESTGINLVRYGIGRKPEVTKLMRRDQGYPYLARLTADGALLAWEQNLALDHDPPGGIHEIYVAHVDKTGKVDRLPTLKIGAGVYLDLVANAIVERRVHRGAIEQLDATKEWINVAPSTRAVVSWPRTYGKHTRVESTDQDGVSVRLRDDTIEAVGAAFTRSTDDVIAHGGARGVTASWRMKTKELALHPIVCPASR